MLFFEEFAKYFNQQIKDFSLSFNKELENSSFEKHLAQISCVNFCHLENSSFEKNLTQNPKP